MTETNFTIAEHIPRYGDGHAVTTSLSKAEDLCDWISGLTSRAVLSDILRERHGMTKASTIAEAAREIGVYVKQGLGFLDQGRSGPRTLAYLPYYYSLLQFSKAVIVASGRST